MKPTLVYMMAATLFVACSAQQPAEGRKSASAQAPGGSELPASWTIRPVTQPVGPDRMTSVRIDVALQAGWHIYSITQPTGGPIATRITVPAGQPFELAGNPKPTVNPVVKFDDAFRMNVQEHEKGVGFTIPVRLSAGAPTADSMHVNVRYQVCNASFCYPPQTAKLVAPVLVSGG